MTLRRAGDRLPRPCPQCGGSLIVHSDQPAAFDAADLTSNVPVYRAQCDKCQQRYDYMTKTGRLIPAVG